MVNGVVRIGGARRGRAVMVLPVRIRTGTVRRCPIRRGGARFVEAVWARFIW